MKDTFGSYDPSCATSFIEKFEGYEAEPYWCRSDRPDVKTIGYGHVIREGEDLSYVSMADAESLLVSDLKKHAEKLMPFVNAECTMGQYVALLSLAFNVGVTAVKNSTLLRLFNSGDEQGAADEFPKWIYAAGKVVEGLKRRREAERKLFLNGI